MVFKIFSNSEVAKRERLNLPNMQDMLALVVRLAWGGALLAHGSGLSKYQTGVAKTAEMVSGLGFPFALAPEPFAVAVIFAELVVPVLILVGLFTRMHAAVAAFNFSVACYAHVFLWGQGLGSILPSAPYKVESLGAGTFLLGALLILALGPGGYSLDGRSTGKAKRA